VESPRVGGVAVLPRLANQVEVIDSDGAGRVRLSFH
jgi:hypothetical protein